VPLRRGDSSAIDASIESDAAGTIDVAPAVMACLLANETCLDDSDCCAALECLTRTTDLGASRARCVPLTARDTVGTEDGPCYPNGICSGGLVCDLGACIEGGHTLPGVPGVEGGLCYADGTCNPFYFCNEFGKCEPTMCIELQAACDSAPCCSAVSCTKGDSDEARCCDRGNDPCESSDECCAGLECTTWEGRNISRCEAIE